MVKIRHRDIQGLDRDKHTEDSFHASPSRPELRSASKNARFDTVLVDLEEKDEDDTGLEGENQMVVYHIRSLIFSKALRLEECV